EACLASLFQYTLPPSVPHPFPTRRSSDLLARCRTSNWRRPRTRCQRRTRPARVVRACFGGNRKGANPDGLAHRGCPTGGRRIARSEEHTSELQSQSNLVCRLLLEKKKK